MRFCSFIFYLYFFVLFLFSFLFFYFYLGRMAYNRSQSNIDLVPSVEEIVNKQG